MPIIIVPKGAQAKLNMFNAREFLEGLAFVDPHVARSKQGSSKRSKGLICKRSYGRDAEKPSLYQVVEDFPTEPKDQVREEPSRAEPSRAE